MNGKAVLIAVAAVVGLVLIVLSSQPDKGNSTNSAGTAHSSPAGTDPEKGRAAILRTEPAPGSLSQSQTAARISALQESHRKYGAHLQAATSIDSENTSAAEAAAREGEELEAKLLQSIADLTEQLKANPELIPDAIELFKSETDPQMMQLIAQAIGEAAQTTGIPFPAEDFLKIAREDASMPRRQAALFALAYMNGVPPEIQQEIAELTRTAPLKEIQMAAIDCMGSWASRNAELKPVVSELLLPTRESSSDIHVRALVIQTIGNMDAPLTPNVLAAMSEAVVHERDPQNRALAAVALGSGTSPEIKSSVLSALEAAYLAEPNLDTQRHIITQITKAARQDAPSILSKLPTPHEYLALDVKDYSEIVASVNADDWGAIWDAKSARDLNRGTTPESGGGHEGEH